MIIDYITYGFKNIKKRKMRSWLTMVGIFVGIAAVVSLISLGQGLQKAIQDEFQSLGADKLIIQPKGGGFGSVGTSPSKLTDEDIDQIKKTKGVDTAIGLLYHTAIIEFDDDQYVSLVYGMPMTPKENELVTQMNVVEIESGRALKSSDTGKAVVGYRYAHNQIFKRNLRLGDKILVDNIPLEIVGFMEQIGSEIDDTVIYVTQDQIEKMYDIAGQFDFVYVKASSGVDPQDLVEPVERTLRKSRDVDEGQEDFEVQTFQEVLESFLSIFRIVQAVIVGIAAISLLVGAIGITNTMYTAVLERTKEIGVMKAIGAKNSDVLTIFLIESGFLGLAGGTIGIIFGTGISKLVEIVAAQSLGTDLLRAYFPAWLIFGALAFAIVIGMAAGVMPAKQASSLQPVDALRYE
ncbi:ABC transporter permease [Candidatus Woesearchaeota archaeon]|nr:ABC transporter permease [Candidatus Woesearchaeota archaeon]